MKFGLKWLGVLLVLFLSALLFASDRGKEQLWLTTPDRSALFAKQMASLEFGKPSDLQPAIAVDDRQILQTIDGFGFALTGGSAQHLMHMAAPKRAALLQELFATSGTDIGVSYLRVSIGSSDLNDHVFSYDDLPAGQTDPDLAKFSLDPDRGDVIPILKEILAINPQIKILGSPWSAPPWMKTNNDVKGGSLKPEYYGAYAKYFVRYIQGMKAEGIRIDAITIQNEPLNDQNTPSMVMQAPEEAAFIKDALGPAFKAAGIDTKIILYDHNCDVPEYATSILADPEAAQYVDGSGFHLYGGAIDALSQVHAAYPNKNLYFTEQMVINGDGDPARIAIARPMKDLIIGATRNWSRNVLLWNLAANSKNEPHTDNGGCSMCQGAVTIDGDRVKRNLAYYTVAHASKFVRPGSVRIGSNEPDGLPNVAFKTPEGKIVLIVVNDGPSSQRFEVRFHGKGLTMELKAGAVGTLLW